MNIKLDSYLPKGANLETHGRVTASAVAAEDIADLAGHLYNKMGLPLKLIDATDERQKQDGFKVWYVFGLPGKNHFIALYVKLENQEFPSIARVVHEALHYERRIQSLFGLKALGIPDDRSLILHEENWPKGAYPLRKDFGLKKRPEEASGKYQFQLVSGEGIYEIPVGPIHAGIIEPGHFRFSVAGEEIMLLEARLGYVHKGSEKLFESLGLPDKLRLSEKISGDSSFSHSLAFCQAVESLADIRVPERAQYLRLIYAELERLANHFGDIGFIMQDTGFNFGGAHGARLREQVMRLNQGLTGSRFLRGVNAYGGVTRDIAGSEVLTLSKELETINHDFNTLMTIANANPTLLNRLKGTGVLKLKIAKDHGTVGVAARAVGMQVDARIDYPYSAYDRLGLKTIATMHGGDVYARFHVRAKEVQASIGMINEALTALSKTAAEVLGYASPKLAKNGLAIGCVEGWRGEIVYFVTTDAAGEIARVAVRDPSFLNWQVLGYAGAGNMVPDFPLINKSFNLSYSGNDL